MLCYLPAVRASFSKYLTYVRFLLNKRSTHMCIV